MKRMSILLAVAFAANAALASDARTAAQANNTFGFQLFKEMTKTTDKGNKFLSPVSAYLALSMALNGATDNTRAEMERALAVSSLSRSDLNGANAALIGSLTGGNRDFDLSIANSLWARKGFGMKRSFLQDVQGSYRATLEMLDFGLPSAAKTINDWVKRETRDRIDGIVPERLPADLRLLLVNATYFEAKWTQPFKDTWLRDFTREDGTKVQVPLMSVTGVFNHVKTADYEAIDLPYGQNGDVVMTVVLPRERLGRFVDAMDADRWSEITRALDATNVELGSLVLPKIEFSYESSLVSALASDSLGMRQAFTDGAQFDDLTDDSVKISEVLQKTFVKVFEKGTIAAAVTGVSVSITSVGPMPKFHMSVDRPYFFAIRDKSTGAVLFVGAVAEPEGGKMPESSDSV